MRQLLLLSTHILASIRPPGPPCLIISYPALVPVFRRPQPPAQQLFGRLCACDTSLEFWSLVVPPAA